MGNPRYSAKNLSQYRNNHHKTAHGRAEFPVRGKPITARYLARSEHIMAKKKYTYILI
jgi:hypothetical protein